MKEGRKGKERKGKGRVNTHHNHNNDSITLQRQNSCSCRSVPFEKKDPVSFTLEANELRRSHMQQEASSEDQIDIANGINV